MQKTFRLTLAALSIICTSTLAEAQTPASLAVPGFGAIRPVSDVSNRPDPSLRYRVAFETTRAAPDPSQINPALDRVARFMNLLAAGDVRPQAGDVIVVIHGPATPSILSDAAYRTRFGRENPNTALLAALKKAGVSVQVCSYALMNQKIARDAVAQGVQVDLAAMVTLANLQLKGWALISG